MTGSPPVNGMSVDVEEWFQVGAFERTIDRDDWDSLGSRVEANCDAILALFDRTETKATFFTLGWVAAAFPTPLALAVEPAPKQA